MVTRTVWAWARLLGGSAIVALLLWRLGTGALLDGLRVIDGPTLLTAFLIGLLTTVGSAWRWSLVARGLGIRLPMRAAVADYYRSLFLNAALPGGVLGDVHRAVRHGRDVGNVGRGVRAVVLERTAGQVMLVSVAVAVLLTLPSPVQPQLRSGSVGQIAAIGAVTVACTVGLLVVLRRQFGLPRWIRPLRSTARDVRSLLRARGSCVGIMLASAVILAGHLATFLVAARAVGSSASIARLIPLMLLALLAMALPLNVGGWGPREGVAAWAFAAAGMSAAEGFTVAVVYGLFAFVASLPGAGVLFVRWIARLRAARAQRVRQRAARLRAARIRAAQLHTVAMMTIPAQVDPRARHAVGIGGALRQSPPIEVPQLSRT